MVEAKSSAVLRSLQGSGAFGLRSPRCGVSFQNRFEQQLESAVLSRLRFAPPSSTVYQPYYRPPEVVDVPSGFPRVQGDLFTSEPAGGMPLDIAFFVFAMEQNNYIQYVAALQLQRGGWAFDGAARRWLRRKPAGGVGAEGAVERRRRRRRRAPPRCSTTRPGE